MTEIAPDRRAAVRTALGVLVAEHGDDLLSSPARMSNVIKDLLPDDQQMSRILVVATEQDVASKLRDHVSQGMDVSIAKRLVSTSFAASTMFSPQACSWVVGEMAIAMGLTTADFSPDLAPPSADDSLELPDEPLAPDPATRTHPPTRRVDASGPTAGLGQPPSRRKQYLAVAATAFVILVAAVTLAIKGFSSPTPSRAPSQGHFVIDRQILNDGSLVLTLTAIDLRHNLMTAYVSYHNVSGLPEILSCLDDSDPSTSFITLANGNVVHSAKTYCSDHPSAELTLGAGATHTSYATFPVGQGFPQPFSFNWSTGSRTGTVSHISL